MQLAVSYITYDTSSRDIITFIQFKEGNALSETRDIMESGKKSDDNSTLPPLMNKE